MTHNKLTRRGKLDPKAVYQRWNGPKPDADAEARKAIENSGTDDAKDFMTGDPQDPLDANAIYAKWNGGRGHEAQG